MFWVVLTIILYICTIILKLGLIVSGDIYADKERKPIVILAFTIFLCMIPFLMEIIIIIGILKGIQLCIINRIKKGK